MNNNSGVSAGIVRLTMLQVFPRYHLPKHLKQHAPFHLSHCKSDFLQTFQSFILFMISGKEEVHTLSAGCKSYSMLRFGRKLWASLPHSHQQFVNHALSLFCLMSKLDYKSF